MVFEDRSIICKDCQASFLFTAGEQGFFLEIGLLNEPQRCCGCRDVRRRERSTNTRTVTTVICAECGDETTVPFVPRLNRPVYCIVCYRRVQSAAIA